MKEFLYEILDKVLDFSVRMSGRIILALVVLVVGLRLSRLLAKMIISSKGMKKADPTLFSFLDNVIKLLFNSLVIISSALIIGIPAASFVAVLGTAGVAIGLALQGAFSNFAGGIMLLIFRPFKVGDYIETSSLAGTVNDISIFYTVLKTPDNKHITIPNGTLMNSSVTNYSVEATRRLDIDFTVSYDSDVEKAKELILARVNEHESALKEPAPFCRLTSYGESAVVITLRVWADKSKLYGLKIDLLEQIKADFDNNGISIPFPQLDVHLDK